MLVPSEIAAQKWASPGRRRLCLAGSTGSIGRSALEIVRAHPDKFEVFALCAGSSVENLLQQAAEFRPRYAVFGDDSPETRRRFEQCRGSCSFQTDSTEFLFGTRALCEVAAAPEADIVLAAVVGFAGLASTLAALRAGKFVALANKESLVCAGELIARVQRESGSLLVPVDSEHSALFQALQGADLTHVRSLILTASGGPFLRRPLEELRNVRPADALQHPRWKMGAKITIDSATMVNKALEVIEAYWLFGLEERQIEVVIHPQSIVHSLVNFRDGTQIAQLSVPDMKGPIAYSLNYPRGRLDRVLPGLDLAAAGNLEFEAFDNRRFAAVGLARAALRTGGVAPAVFNMANEFAVGDFLAGRLSFDRIVSRIDEVLSAFPAGRGYLDLDELSALQGEVKQRFFS